MKEAAFIIFASSIIVLSCHLYFTKPYDITINLYEDKPMQQTITIRSN